MPPRPPIQAPIPESDPAAEPRVCIRLNEEWVSWVVGAVEPLLVESLYQGTEAEKDEQRRRVGDLIAILSGLDTGSCSNVELGDVIWTARGSLTDKRLPCDGRILEPADYPELFAVIDSVYITPAGKIQLPNIRNRTLVGAGDLYTVGETGGSTNILVNLGRALGGALYTAYKTARFAIGGERTAPALVGTYGRLPDVAGQDTTLEHMPPFVAGTFCMVVKP